MPGPAQHIPHAGGLLWTWAKCCWGLAPSKHLFLFHNFQSSQFLAHLLPLSLWKPHSSAQPYLMNFSMTSSTHICSRRKLMP